MVNALFFVYSWFVFAPLMLAATLLAGLLCFVLVPFLGPRRAGRLTAVPWSRLGLLLSGVQVRLHGLEHLDPKQSYVIVANHLSQFDIWVLYGHLNKDFRWVMKQELRKVPVIGPCCALLGHIFIDRGDSRAAQASLESAKARLVDGTSILFFPEGTRSRDGELRRFKKGAFRMARDLDLPLLPVTLTGTREILPPDSLRMHPGTVALTLHAPVTVDGDDEAALDQAVERCRSAIAGVAAEGCLEPT
ncbi:lysophospholipid acyltransferase family protein [Alloalcanivorax gelatiniphagus]|uniref:1-acyl-sn-glycerol-3-phosphate acyltransferase n=1 Tax=Alloalcanivorax gelatiniphagus TaxID=1194167 RepID=A0ABY2XJP1_9GAMM|nr:lysophospholipid acyltransferase family protein [Alloalcanivorax gelatiniphagus]TMW12159.1 1-acyl-sn-glycerol-3-phosphate acyltransferase [Alloalcanivorax gelatiniphagus]|tara:strand:+ start:15214 stop:15954 length:741 start_codon:yes stop_codon:yes gene_type:complete